MEGWHAIGEDLGADGYAWLGEAHDEILIGLGDRLAGEAAMDDAERSGER